MAKTLTADYVQSLELDLKKVELEILKLQKVKRSLETLMLWQKAEGGFINESFKNTKKNKNRIQFWTSIFKMLLDKDQQDPGQGLTTSTIYERLLKEGINIKYSTVRSHIHRLKNEGLIYQYKHGGMWRLSERTKVKEEQLM